MEELISIIINVYNGEKFIDKCLNSVVNQTYKHIEILIINDGSTDNTLKICQEYNDNRIRIITQENKGLSLSRNVGIENAKGEYLYFVDADDIIANDTIEHLYKLCKKYNTLMATCKCMIVYDYDFDLKNKKEKDFVISSEKMLKNILLIKNKAGTTWNKLMHKSLFDNIRFENRIVNDIVVTHKLVIKAKNIACSNQIKYYFLRHKSSITAQNNKRLDRLIDNYKASIERYEYIKEIYPNMVQNEIFLIGNIMRLYLEENSELDKYLDENGAKIKLKECLTYKVILYPMKPTLRIKIILFITNLDLCRHINRRYGSKKYKYKM